MKRGMYLLIIAGVASVVPFLLGLHKTSSNEPKGMESLMADGRRIAHVQGVGYLEPISDVRRLSFEMVGVIESCNVDMGDQVENGQVLMKLRDDEATAAVALAKGELAGAKASRASIVRGVHGDRIEAVKMTVERLRAKCELEEIEYQRINRLFREKNAASDEFDSARLELAQTRAAVAEAEAELRHLVGFVRTEDLMVADARIMVAEANLQLAEARMAKTLLRAPFQGTVLDIHRRAGESAEPTVSVMSFGDLTRLRVRAEVDERFVNLLAVGQDTTMTSTGASPVTLNGAISSIKPMMGRKRLFAGSSTERADLDVVEVLIELERTDAMLPAGFRLDVTIDCEVQKSL